MKILAIRIKNLASLEGRTEIDFTAEPLCTAGIFAITGATGAGKSTILDALCLALYGKTPRYLQARETGIEIRDVQGSTLSQGDVRSILRDGTADGYAEVDFRGIDGQRYRASWSVRRARNKAEGSMQSDTITLTNITSDTAIPGKKQETLNEIARLVGLSFDQFTRSVLLAQGDFTAFMKASKDEKSSLLEKLTGTSVYSEISKKTYEKFKSEEQKLRDLHLRKEGIITLTEEELAVLLDEQNVLETNLKSLEQDLENLTAEINWYDQLTRMQAKQDEALTAFQDASDAKTNALKRKQKLWVTEQAQQTRSWADALKNATQQHSEKTETLQALKEASAALQAQKQMLDSRLLDSENTFKAKNQALLDALPMLEQAMKLDTLLSEKKEQLDKTGIEAEQASEKSINHQALLNEKQAVFIQLSEGIKTLTNWKTENSDRSMIAENREIILSKLQDAQKLLETLQLSTDELAVLKSKITAAETKKTDLETLVHSKRQEWEELKKSYGDRAAALLMTPVETLEKDKKETDRNIENTIQGKADWELLHSSQAEYETLSRKQLKDQSEYRTKQKTLEQLVLQLATEKVQKETSARMLEQARLASAENIESLRSSLTDEEPCPVCGSTHHPYVVQNPQLENVLSALESINTENERIYMSTFRLHNALEQECETLAKTIQDQGKAIVTLQAVLENRKQVWHQSDIAKESRFVTDPEKTAWIESRLKDLKAKQAALQAKIQDYKDRRQELEKDKNLIDQLKETSDSLKEQLKDAETAIILFQEQQSSKIREKDKASSGLLEAEQSLSSYFNAPGWAESWKAAPAAFIERIENFAEKWKKNTDKLEQCEKNKSILGATIKEMESLAHTLATAVTEKTEVFREQQQNYLHIKQQRDRIFEGQAAEEAERELKTAVSDAQEQFDMLKTKQQLLILDITKASAQQEELTGTLTGLKADMETAFGKLQNWLDEYNIKNNASLNIEELNELLSLPHDWLDSERSAIQTIEEEVTKAGSVLAERKQLLQDHQQKGISVRPLDELNILMSTAKTEAEQKKQKKGEISFRLQQDEMHKSRIGDLLQSITEQAAVTENWSKLNEIIGSADGKKFRQIAQEYTLDVLLGYANVHLKELTGRYRIERIPASLGLQVVDQDMGDEVRTVYSLSGGESFLVSLALALGLASLSSSRMKVESLFIDEGFGSLDPTTLNIAMDALERLYNQGRKVGVISHVQEMTERIPVQIKVSKQQSGKSVVEVTGY
ncbi:AAA family ATPase [Chryseobacterium gregarium]|uniref:AAA family ATPase n=1 Tax=Chryseobacterium gregarium TaxID=456299 RepID=UPI000412D1C3|nr:AAA family ATPase [Chryseobacterium gregarium]